MHCACKFCWVVYLDPFGVYLHAQLGAINIKNAKVQKGFQLPLHLKYILLKFIKYASRKLFII